MGIHEVGRIASESIAIAAFCRKLSFLLEMTEVANTLPREQLNQAYFSWDSERPLPSENLIHALFEGQFDFEDEDDAYVFEAFYVSIGSPLRIWTKIKRTAKQIATAAAIAASSPTAPVATVPVAVPAVAATAAQAPQTIALAAMGFAGVGALVATEEAIRDWIQDSHDHRDEINQVVDQMRLENERNTGFVLQRCLTDVGLYDGRIDGIVGPKARAAAGAYMVNERMPKGTSLSDPGFLRALATDATEVRHRA